MWKLRETAPGVKVVTRIRYCSRRREELKDEEVVICGEDCFMCEDEVDFHDGPCVPHRPGSPAQARQPQIKEGYPAMCCDNNVPIIFWCVAAEEMLLLIPDSNV